MQSLNYVSCLVTSNNTGFGRCVPTPGQLVYDIAIPKGKTFALADLQPETLLATLLALTTEDDPALRGYLLGKWSKVEDSSADAVVESQDGGNETTLFDGAYKWTRHATKGGLCIHDGLRKYNRSQDQFDWLHVFKATDGTAKYYIVGRKKWNATTNENELAGLVFDDVWAPKWGLPTGNKAATFSLKTVMADTEQLNEQRAFVATSIEIDELPRIMDIDVAAKKVSTGVFEVNATMACGGASVATEFPALVDDAAWVCENELGNVVAVLGVTAVGGKLRFALDTSDANYVAGTKFRFYTEPISVTSASPFDVEYVESGKTQYVAK